MRYMFLLFLITACDGFEPYSASDIYWADGDSGTIDGERFRLADVDAPEIRGAQCEAERLHGEAAKAYIRQLSLGVDIQIVADFGQDRYDRRVIELEFDGQNVSDLLLARDYLQAWPHLNGRALNAKPDWC